MIAVVDYGVGNIRNVAAALREVDLDVEVTNDPRVVSRATGVVLPGVGAYRDAAANLRDSGLVPALESHVRTGKALLGICLGMQLLYEGSSEAEGTPGLGWLRGRFTRFDGTLKVPHMGWNVLTTHRPDPITADLEDSSSVYFLHSYYLQGHDPGTILATAEYGVDVPAIVRADNLVGMQFHPEKSGAVGLRLLRRVKEALL